MRFLPGQKWRKDFIEGKRKLRGGAVRTREFFLSASCDDLGWESCAYRPSRFLWGKRSVVKL